MTCAAAAASQESFRVSHAIYLKNMPSGKPVSSAHGELREEKDS